MAKQRKAHKKNPHTAIRAAQRGARTAGGKIPLRLSQCMIVKNEESNIVRALTWAKDLAFEQIVVDTGSTDRTVEIAESMGAKVFHFEWIDDFSAAKNYAIEQCSGEWIAFLDADEFVPEKDLGRLQKILIRACNEPEFANCMVLVTPMVQTNDEGNVFALTDHQRFFRNRPGIRYINRIHETLNWITGIYEAPEISIVHTGYAKSVYAERGKAERNIEMIRKELENSPDDVDLMCYLGDSLRIKKIPEQLAEAEELYRRALDSGRHILPQLKQSAYGYLIAVDSENEERRHISEELSFKAMNEFPSNPDFTYAYAAFQEIKHNDEMAWEYYKKAEAALNSGSVHDSNLVVTEPLKLFFSLLCVAERKKDYENVIHYATLILKESKYQNGILAPYISALKAPGYAMASDDEIMALLEKMYDLTNIKDKLFIIRAAKEADNQEVASRVFSMISESEIKWLEGEDGEGDGGEEQK